jgi:hypothetical protein
MATGCIACGPTGSGSARGLAVSSGRSTGSGNGGRTAGIGCGAVISGKGTLAGSGVVPASGVDTGGWGPMNQLEQLKQYTTVVADTGNFHAAGGSLRRRMPPPTPA